MSDKILFTSVVAMYTLSIIMVYSLSVYTTQYYGYSDTHFLLRQGMAVTISLFVIYIFSSLDPDKWFMRVGFTILTLSLILMVSMPFLPSSMVKEIMGAKRWVRIGSISIAPVEFFKIGFVFFTAWSFNRRLIHKGELSFAEEIKVILPYILAFVGLVFLIAIFQKDLGQVVVLAIMLLIMFVIAGRSMKLFVSFIALGIFAIIILIEIAPHRIRRIKDWWGGIQDKFLSFFPDSIGDKLRVDNAIEPYQVSNSLNAIYDGGWFGQGLGNGRFKLGYLSEIHTDFILSGIAEELGFFALILLSSVMLVILFRLLRIASKLTDPVYYLFTVGVALLILFAFIINSYGISGLTPVKGIAVPFLSYGGSQILAGAMAIGMVLMISKKAESREKGSTDSIS
jgi:cell division protein FtsW